MADKKERYIASPMERGEQLRLIKAWALKGYLQSGDEDSSREEFERIWREAFHADVEVGGSRPNY